MARLTYVPFFTAMLLLTACGDEIGSTLDNTRFPVKGSYTATAVEMDIELGPTEQLLRITNEEELKQFVLDPNLYQCVEQLPFEVSGSTFVAEYVCEDRKGREQKFSYRGSFSAESLEYRVDFEEQGYPFWHETTYRLAAALPTN